MESGLTDAAFHGLLGRLDTDREQAGEKYEELRSKLIRFFEWRGAPFPEEQTDETLDRLCKKIAAGVPVKNVSSYCQEIARLVCLEALKGADNKRTSLDAVDTKQWAARSGD